MIEGWGRWALGTAVEAGVVGIVLWIAAAALRPGPRARSVLYALGLAQFVVPPWLQLWEGPVSLHVEAGFLEVLPLVLRTIPVDLGAEAAPLAESGTPASGIAVVLFLLQTVGLLVGILLLARSSLAVRGILSGAVPVEHGPLREAADEVGRRMGIDLPPLYLVERAGPAATGILRPVIFLPRHRLEELDPGVVRMVLAHELEHVNRSDPLAGALRHLVVSLWWFHPLAWMLAAGHRRAAEDRCDDTALSQEPGREEEYCASLLALAAPGSAPAGSGPWRVSGGPGPASAFLGSHPLGRRFRRMLDPGERRRADRQGRGIAEFLLLLSTLLAVPLEGVSVGLPSDERTWIRETRVEQNVQIVRHVESSPAEVRR